MAVALTTAADGIDHLPILEMSPAANARKANTGLFIRASASAVRPGVLPGPSTWVLSYGSPTADQWYLTAGSAVLSDGAGGSLVVTSGSTKSEAVTRPGSGTSRYDVIALEPVFTGSPAVSVVRYAGTASASPSLSTATSQVSANGLVVGSYLLANTGAPTITMAPQYAAVAPGPLHIRDSADRTALDSSGALYPGFTIFRRDLGYEQVNPTGVPEATTAGSWQPKGGHIVAPTFGAAAQSITSGGTGNLGSITVPALSRGATLHVQITVTPATGSNGKVTITAANDTRVTVTSSAFWMPLTPQVGDPIVTTHSFPVAPGPAQSAMPVSLSTPGASMTGVRMLYWVQG